MENISLFGERTSYSFTIPSSCLADQDEDRTVMIKAHTIERIPSEKLGDKDIKLFANHIWPGSIVMADYLVNNQFLYKSRSIIELGAGAALPSIVCSITGAKLVTITDFPDINIIENIDYLLSLNNCPRKDTKVLGHTWGESVEDLVILTEDKKGYDIVLLAEVLWKDTYHLHHPLLQSAWDCLNKSNIDSQILITVAHRPGSGHTPQNDLEFFQLAEKEFKLHATSLLQTSQYTDAMDNEEIEVTLYSLKFLRPEYDHL